VEEIKTLRVAVEDLPASLKEIHFAQLKIYGFMLCQAEAMTRLNLRLCYLDLDDHTESWLEEEFTTEALQEFFKASLSRLVKWLARNKQWLETRNKSIELFEFPYPGYRPGQRDMAVAAYRSIVDGEQVVLQAPTGIGKTMATIFPSIKAMREGGYDKLFYLSAKTSGQRMAEETIAEINDSGLRFRSLTLTAKDKICFNKGSPCDPDHCQYARGYYDRLADGIEDALALKDQLDRETIESVAEKHVLCPFELSLDISRSVDLVICDYNYVFDPVVYLRRFFEDNPGKYALLVDEAHNLVDRGRDMFSAELKKDDFLALRRQLKEHSPVVARELARVNAEILAMRKVSKIELESRGFLILEKISSKFTRALRRFCESAENLLKEDSPGYKDELLSLYFECLRFLRTEEQTDEDYAFLLVKVGKHIHVKLFCINPATRLQQGFSKMSSSVCFSATMKPQSYFQGLLGMGENTSWYQLTSPFDPAHLGVFVAPYIGTSYRERDASVEKLVQLIRKVVESKAGNYLVFFPSHLYLRTVYEAFLAASPQHETQRETIAQERFMTEDDRQDFLDRFREGGQVTGFAVMGGVFAEGVDLKGSRLIGVVITGVGLPQIGIERDLIRDYWNREGVGFEFAYQYPGMNKVLQTAGRVIRDSGDRGIVCLVDRRFTEMRYRDLFPPEWQVERTPGIEELETSLANFWQNSN
jgi:Rad3-related DNA helicase